MTDRNKRVRFCDNNLAGGAAATVSASSSHASYPIANLTDSYRFRSWKPTGAFTITSANNKVYIYDGSNKTVTLTSGVYATGALLAAHIQTQVLASSTTWTCSYNSTTYKFTLNNTSNPTCQLRLTQTTAAVWDTIGYTGTLDQVVGSAADVVRIHTSEYVSVDLGVASSITFAALIAPLGTEFPTTNSATWRLMGNTTSSMTSPALTVTLTEDVNGIFQFMDDLANTSYRYWRLELIDRDNPAGPSAFEFGHFYLGDYTTITQRNVASGLEKTYVDPSQGQESEGGALFFRTKTKYRKFESASIQYMNATDRRALEQVFYDKGKSSPFYVSFDPTLAVSTTLSELTAYVIFQDEPKFTHVKSDIYSVTMSFREVM